MTMQDRIPPSQKPAADMSVHTKYDLPITSSSIGKEQLQHIKTLFHQLQMPSDLTTNQRQEIIQRLHGIISHTQSSDRSLLMNKLDQVSHFSEKDKYSYEINQIMDEVNSAGDISQIRNALQELKQVGQYLSISRDDCLELHTQFLTICDRFAERLIDRTQHHGHGPDDDHSQLQARTYPLDGNENYQARLGMAAEIRKLAASHPVAPALLGMDTISSRNPVDIVLIGNKMDTGTHYHNIDSQKLRNNQLVITRREIQDPQSPANQIRTELKFQLTPLARTNLNQTLNLYLNPQFVQFLSQEFESPIVITQNAKANYEVSLSPANHNGPVVFEESKANYANMVSIEVKGLGQILIGNEDMSVPDNNGEETISKGTKGRYLAHHTVLVRVYNAPPEDTIDASEQMKKMHKLLSLAGLSSALTQGSKEEQQKQRVIQIIDTYLPHIGILMNHNSQVFLMNAEERQQLCLELLTQFQPRENEEGNITVEEMRTIFERELSGNLQYENTPVGKEVPKLTGVAERMREKGACGFFAGIAGGPRVVVSMLKNGGFSADTRSSLGFKFPSTCQEDAITGGNEAIYLRLATEGTINQMTSGNIKLSNAPYINNYQMIVDLDVANFPHNRMHHNSFGLINPSATVVISRGDKASEVVSGEQLLLSESPMHFTEEENRNPSLDNEFMIRTGVLNPQHITKITYQDPRLDLINLLRLHGYPEDDLDKLFVEEKPDKAPIDIASAVPHASSASDARRKLKLGNISDVEQNKIQEFLIVKGLIENKENWNKEKYLALKIKPEFQSEDDLKFYFSDPKPILVQELQNANLIDKHGKIYGKSIDEFIVETRSLTRSLFM